MKTKPQYEKMPWTPGPWFPEEEPTFNEDANAYQIAIVQATREGRTIPGFAFGDTKEQCVANAWLLSAAKDLLKALQQKTKECGMDGKSWSAIAKALNQLSTHEPI
jgi:hypothetical protein